MPKFLNIFFLAGGLLATVSASAQGLGNSPYSRLGLGDLNSGGNIRITELSSGDDTLQALFTTLMRIHRGELR